MWAVLLLDVYSLRSCLVAGREDIVFHREHPMAKKHKPATRREIAFHEAGHAVAAVLLRVPFSYVALTTENAESLGHVQHDPTAVARFVERVQAGEVGERTIARHIQVTLAGVRAAKLAGESGQGGESDDVAAHNLAEEICGPVYLDQGAEVVAYLSWAEAAVSNLLRGHWPAVEAVAAALERGTILKAGRVRALVLAAPAPPSSSPGHAVPGWALDAEIDDQMLERLLAEAPAQQPQRPTKLPSRPGSRRPAARSRRSRE